jgi:hypothetical protein
MKTAQWFNAIALASAASLAVNLLVVCLLYGLYLDQFPRIREEWPTVLGSTLITSALSLLTGCAFFAQRREWPRRDLIQGATYVGVAVGMFLLYRILI